MTASLPLPVAAAPAPVVSSTPAASANAAAPDSLAVDFMAMIGQMTATTAPTPATAAMQTTPVLPAWEETQDTKSDDESTDMLGALPISLPVMPMEFRQDTANLQANALVSITAGQGSAVAPQAQLLSDLIQTDKEPDAKPFEVPQLPQTPVTDTTSPLRQAENAHTRPVNVPVGSAAWADEIGSRLTMMAEQGKHTASLRLSPEHLGPLEIRISMTDDKASVWFGAAHADTRSAIENALPRLRELLASQGLSLTDANVSREPPRQQQTLTQQSSSSSGGSFSGEEGVAAAAPVRVRLGLLDAYA